MSGSDWDVYLTRCAPEDVETVEQAVGRIVCDSGSGALFTPVRWFHLRLDAEHVSLLSESISNALRCRPEIFSADSTESLSGDADEMMQWAREHAGVSLPRGLGNLWGGLDTAFFITHFTEPQAREVAAAATSVTGSPAYPVVAFAYAWRYGGDGWSAWLLYKALSNCDAPAGGDGETIRGWTEVLGAWLHAYDWTDDEDGWGSPFDPGNPHR